MLKLCDIDSRWRSQLKFITPPCTPVVWGKIFVYYFQLFFFLNSSVRNYFELLISIIMNGRYIRLILKVCWLNFMTNRYWWIKWHLFMDIFQSDKRLKIFYFKNVFGHKRNISAHRVWVGIKIKYFYVENFYWEKFFYWFLYIKLS